MTCQPTGFEKDQISNDTNTMLWDGAGWLADFTSGRWTESMIGSFVWGWRMPMLLGSALFHPSPFNFYPS
jgi:hypothetical protein